MSLLVVTRGLFTEIAVPASVTQYGIVGPFAAGCVLDRVELTLFIQANSIVSFGLALSQSAVASAEGFASGVSLIQRGTNQAFGKPILRVSTAAQAVVRYSIPLGIHLQAGSWYVHLVIGESASGLTCTAGVGVFALRPVVQLAGGEVVPVGG